MTTGAANTWRDELPSFLMLSSRPARFVRASTRRRRGPRGKREQNLVDLVETGVTIAGENLLPATITVGKGLSDSQQPDVVQAEGAAPVHSPPTQHNAVTVWLFRAGEEPAVVDLAELPELVAVDADFVWVDLSSYDEGDLRRVAELLDLNGRAVQAALSPWQRPRLSVFDTHFFTSATIVGLDAAAYRVRANELDLFVGRNYLVSAHKQPLPFHDHLLGRAWHSPELIRLDAAYMLYLVLDEVFAYYEELDRHLQGEIERLEERALRDASDRFLEDLLRFKRYAFALSQLADQHRPVLAAFLQPDFHWVAGEELEDDFGDLEDRLSRLSDALTSAREAVNGAFNIYVSHMSHRTNQVIKVLTMVSTVLLPATVIIALFGISISVSLRNLSLNTPSGLALMLLCIVLVSGGTLYAFHRRGWL